jgi:ATP-dependent Clp protease ATP-binding subunit ClpB
MIRIDMSEYMEKHAVARLIGAPPGYVGYEEGGQLTEAVRRRPYAVVLLDEIEKAHPDVFNVLLQVLDDGRLTDGKGRTVDFRNTLVIMTSNIGSRVLQAAGPDKRAEAEATVERELKDHFRPEFLNRVDDVVLFGPLDREAIERIVDIQVSRLEATLADRGIALELSAGARRHLARVGYDPAYGARPLKRALQREVVNALAVKVLEGDFASGDRVIVEAGDEGLVFRRVSRQVPEEEVETEATAA